MAHQFQEQFARSSVDELKRALLGGFKLAIKELLNDPLMECFRASKESQEFMLDRIEEIVYGSVQKVNADVISGMKSQLDEYKDQIKQLSERHQSRSAESSESAAKLQDFEMQLKQLRQDNQRLKYLSKDFSPEQSKHAHAKSRDELKLQFGNAPLAANLNEKGPGEKPSPTQLEAEEKIKSLADRLVLVESKWEASRKQEGTEG